MENRKKKMILMIVMATTGILSMLAMMVSCSLFIFLC